MKGPNKSYDHHCIGPKNAQCKMCMNWNGPKCITSTESCMHCGNYLIVNDDGLSKSPSLKSKILKGLKRVNVLRVITKFGNNKDIERFIQMATFDSKDCKVYLKLIERTLGALVMILHTRDDKGIVNVCNDINFWKNLLKY